MSPNQAHKPPGVAYNVVMGILLMLAVAGFLVVLLTYGPPIMQGPPPS